MSDTCVAGVRGIAATLKLSKYARLFVLETGGKISTHRKKTETLTSQSLRANTNQEKASAISNDLPCIFLKVEGNFVKKKMFCQLKSVCFVKY